MQPLTVRLLIWVNILFWGLKIPMPEFIPANALTFNALLTIILGFCSLSKNRNRNYLPVLFTVVVVLYGLLVFMLNEEHDGLLRVLLSSLLLIIIIISITSILSRVDLNLPILSLHEIRLIILIIIFSLLFSISNFSFENFAMLSIKVGGIYDEASHVGLSVAPLIYYQWTMGDNTDRKISVFFITILIFTSLSSTLVILLVFMFSLPIFINLSRKGNKIKYLLNFLLVIVTIVIFFSTNISSETYKRMTSILDSSSNNNVSSLVYINGWELLKEYLYDSRYLGIGFNAMGTKTAPITNSGLILEKFGLSQLNYNDGSFLLSKIGSELGVVGIFFWIILCTLTIKTATVDNSSIPKENVVFIYSFLFVNSIGGVLRSGSYFTGPAILGIISIITYYEYSKTNFVKIKNIG